MDIKKLVIEIKQEINLQDDVTDEVIELYLLEGEKQVKNYIGTEKLTSMLVELIKKYTKQKMIENGNKYNARVQRKSGLDDFFKGYKHTLDSHKRLVGKTGYTLSQYKKKKDIQKNYAIEQRENRKRD